MADKRQDTRIEAEGAEFLVCRHLLIEGIPTYKTYTQMPGYDLVATNPERGSLARIQVKSRWASDSDRSFPMKNADCDFVVFVALNRGFRFGKKEGGRKSPEFFVFPAQVALIARIEGPWNKVSTRKIIELEQYRDGWQIVRGFLDSVKAETATF